MVWAQKLLWLVMLVAIGGGACFHNLSQSAQPGDPKIYQFSSEQKNPATIQPHSVSPGPSEKTPPSSAGIIYIIFDASGSMAAKLPDKRSRIDAAKEVLHGFVSKDFSGHELALRVYGHRKKEDCTDSELLIPIGPPEKVVQSFKTMIQRIVPLGRTPITFSLIEALKDIGERQAEIILITDGIESCEADPCALVQEWRAKNIQVKVHVVGFGVDEKAKKTLGCISTAAGTQFHDATTAPALAEELAKIHQKTVKQGFILKGQDTSGVELLVNGTLSQNNIVRYQVNSAAKALVDAGEYVLSAGVKTANGNLYQPVIQRIKILENETTTVTVTVPLPPSVKARFAQGQEVQPHNLIAAYQNGKEVFKFRAIDKTYLDEGTYEFQSKIPGQDLPPVTETFGPGDHKEILFQLIQTVKVFFKMVAAGSEVVFRDNMELWQGNQKIYEVHSVNGATVTPGIYELHLLNKLVPHVSPGVTISNQESQHLTISVPVGYITFAYQKADGSPDKKDRCFVSTGSGQERIHKLSNEKHPILPGRYRVDGWSHKGSYAPVFFEIATGEDKTVYLRSTN
ncbi:MAG: hypothetical protein HY774_01010 [Acidobacteria bacterium]|nr:hypothetical protein [Acidobacteriota bacterium]